LRREKKPATSRTRVRWLLLEKKKKGKKEEGSLVRVSVVEQGGGEDEY
jgi:hypothetical protein